MTIQSIHNDFPCYCAQSWIQLRSNTLALIATSRALIVGEYWALPVHRVTINQSSLHLVLLERGAETTTHPKRSLDSLHFYPLFNISRYYNCGCIATNRFLYNVLGFAIALSIAHRQFKGVALFKDLNSLMVWFVWESMFAFESYFLDRLIIDI